MEASEPSCLLNLHGVDDATAALIIQLQCDDLEELQAADKGKGGDDEVPDAVLALQAFEEELQQARSLLADRAMGQSLTQAVITDAAAVTEHIAQEDGVARDHLLADRLSRGEATDVNTVPVPEDADLDDSTIARLRALYVSEARNRDDGRQADEDVSRSRSVLDNA